MKHFFLLSTLLFSASFLHAQEKGNCSAVKRRSNEQAKSNTLSVAQIAQTERYDVHYYFLDLQMTNTATTLSGTVEMRANARENLDSALFELYPTMSITDLQVNGTTTPYVRNNTAVKVPVNTALGQEFVITVTYNGTPPTAQTNPLGGGGMTHDNSPSWGNEVVWSLSESFVAYEWWPCKQSLKDKIDSSDVHITVPTACMAGSNGVLQQIVDLGNGTHRFEWKSRHMIDYYLISVAVAEYVDYTITANPVGSGPVTVQNYVYNNPQTLPYFQSDIDETADFIELYAQLYGPYPFADEKYGHCMAPVSGGMEHQTMTTLGFFEASLTAHELAHQWFGDHVTCASWSDIWVNEGFADYSEYLMWEHLYPGQEVADMQNRHTSIMSQSGGSVWVADSLHDASIFDSRLVYDKGGAILHIMRYLVNNDTAYFNGYKDYQQQFADSTALGLDFSNTMTATTGVDLTNFMQEWYFGEGFPAYSVQWNANPQAVTLQLTEAVSMSSVTPFFSNPVDIRLVRSGMSDTIVRFQPTANVTILEFPIAGVTNCNAIDPANWIINGDLGITHNTALGLTENEVFASDLNIFPNPANTETTVEMKKSGDYVLTVIDTKGKLLSSQKFSGSATIDLSNAASGAYLIQVSSADGTVTRRIVRK